MIRPDELIIDNFAGGGGASTGIEMALGRHIDVAINHDAEAVAMHQVNHPHTRHLCQSVWQADPQDVTQNRPVGLAWFSPDCKHFSKAKGGTPVEKHIRDLAWVVVLWAKRVRPRVIMLENVEEFHGWGPLIEMADGRTMPCPERKGHTFKKWKGELKKLGYKVEERELRACDYGAPTSRKRLFVIARRDGRPIVWPAPTHGNPKSKDPAIRDAVADGRLRPWRTAAEIIDWSLPCPSIFERKKPLAENTLKRIAKGIQRYVLDAAEPFIVSVAHGDSGGRREYPLDEPLGTVTGGGISHALVSAHVAKFRSGAVGSGADEPMPTVTANSFIKRPGGCAPLGVVGATLVGVGGRMGQSSPRTVNAPYHTTTAKADTAIVIPTLISTGYGERPATYECGECGELFQDEHASGVGGLAPAECPKCGEERNIIEHKGQEPRVPGIEKPLGTVVASGVKHALVAPILVGAGGPAYSGKPKTPDDPMNTLTTENHSAVVAAFLAQHNSERGSGVKAGHDAREPVSTITGSGSQQNVVAAHLLNLKGSDRRARAVDEPVPTITGGGMHVAEVRAFLIKYFGSAVGQDVDDPLHTVTSKPRFGLVTIHGVDYVIADIGMRMIQAPELFRAQSFPPGYVIDFMHNGRLLPKSSQVRMCGNSVPPVMSKALVEANFAEPAAEVA
ncbi:MAG TPA: DNA cytosine methyltransferase [Alphaproteobacteria bacterium]|jgi:DNA (cytosine-5)-methyltransferase 1